MPNTLTAPQVRAEITTVTPDVAQLWLANNPKNRALKQGKIEQFARDMVAGRWKLTGEAVKFAPTGELLDGQNRLHAIVRAGIPVQTLVIYGIDPSAQDVMDSGTARTAADALRMQGMRDTYRITAAARIALCIENEVSLNVGRFSNSEVQSWVEAHPEIADTHLITGNHRATALFPGVITYCAWRFAAIDDAAAKEFFEGLTVGAGLLSGSPILALRNRLSGSYGASRRMRPEEQVALTFRAWSAYRNNETLHRLMVSTKNGRISIPTLV